MKKNKAMDRDSGIPEYPFRIFLAVTSRCNLSCLHCFNRGLVLEDPEMSLDEVFSVIDQIAEIKPQQVQLLGGEPLLRPDFKEIVKYLNKRSLNFSLNTNATLVDFDLAVWLKKHGMRSAVVSFDGSSDSVVDKIRGRGAFEKILRGIKALCSQDYPVLLSASINRINYKDLENMAYLAKGLRAYALRFNQIFFAGNAFCFADQLQLSPQQERGVIEEVWRLRQGFGDFISPDSCFLRKKKKLYQMSQYKPSHDRLFIPPCAAGTGFCLIRPDGWLSPCAMQWQMKCGNLKKERLKDIWKTSEIIGSFRRPLEVDLSQVPECKGCRYQELCFFGHRCYPYNYPGGIKNRSLYCLRKEEIIVNLP
jgi:radical SAM protein with 4Fe4S-binding SPASM domain